MYIQLGLAMVQLDLEVSQSLLESGVLLFLVLESLSICLLLLQEGFLLLLVVSTVLRADMRHVVIDVLSLVLVPVVTVEVVALFLEVVVTAPVEHYVPLEGL